MRSADRVRADVKWGIHAVLRVALGIAVLACIVFLIDGDSDLGFSFFLFPVYGAVVVLGLGTAIGVARPWLGRLPVLLVLGVFGSILNVGMIGVLMKGTSREVWTTPRLLFGAGLATIAGLAYGLAAWFGVKYREGR